MPDVEEMPQEQMDSSSSGQDGSPAPAGPRMAPPGAMPAPPQQPPVQVVAANPKAHLFSSLLNVLGGGNQTQYSVDPQTGSMQSISVPQTKGQLAKHILAGVISGMAAGESRPQPGREISQGVMRGAAAQQQQKAQQDLQARQNVTEDYNRQQQSKVRQMQTVEANLRMHQVALQNGRLDKQLHDEAGAGYQDSIDSYTDSGQVVNDNATGQEAMDVQKYPVGDYLRIPKPNSASQRTNDQGKPVFRTPDGQITTEDGNGNQPLYDSRYVIVNANARTPLRAATSEQTGENSTTKTPVPGKEGLLPWVRQAQDYGIGGPQFVKATNMSGDMPAAAATSIQHQVAGLNSLAGELDNFAKKTGQQWKDADGNPVDSKTYLKTQLKSNPGLLKSIDQWRRTSAGDSTEPDIQILDKMDADPKAKSAKSDMIQLFGGGAVLQDYKDKRLVTTAATKSKAEAQAKLDVETSPQAVAGAANKASQETKARVSAENSPEAISGAARKAGAETSARDKAHQAVLETSAHNEDGSWNPNGIPVAMVEGNMDPSQLSKRSKDYDTKIEQANAYSMQKYGKPFNIAQAQSDYKYATAPQTQNTLKYLNSLTGPDGNAGNLGELIKSSNSVSRTQFPALNDAAAWARLESGDPGITAYRTTALEVADQAAKILQGGGTGSGTSDAKLKQASEIFDSGFTKGQIQANAQTLRTLLANRKKEMIGDNRYLTKQYSQQPTQQPMYASKPGSPRMMSSDGGKTWQPAP